jgi:hypothetical protein
VPPDPPSTARSQKRQALVQPGGQALEAKHLVARCGELDRERQAVEPTAYFDHQRGALVGQHEVFDDRGHTLDEKLHDREGCGFRCGQFGRGLWASERAQPILAFARYPQRLPAGRQNGDVLCSAEKRPRQARHLVDDMLAIVEQ